MRKAHAREPLLALPLARRTANFVMLRESVFGATEPRIQVERAISNNHVGDLAISWPTVVRQAREYGHPEQTELGVLVVHGLLHLLGWDHATAAQRKEMSRLTIAALALSGLRPAQGRL